MKKEKRFEVIHKEGSSLRTEGIRMIAVDRETGVNYLIWTAGYGGGITPLLDSEGKPVITPSVMYYDTQNY
ncbi:MAG: hypothetical protein J5738_06225 [Lachnospiraceae bacterium]|nr:hypothetical protein [Lachnospiraceae bacterium]MBO4669162.1 hypothetical protein [Lachnospiraceae bacterium]